ncbi:MAG: leucine-rich repeat protein, partial [Clostridia bacterium]|nr:leucine-rich repeat protein [Clostridia bacterium]
VLLDGILLPDSLIYVGPHAFEETAYLLNPDNWTGSFLFSGHCLLAADPDFAGDLQIPDGTNLIAGGAFTGCGLTSVSMPDGLLSVGPEAFMGCARLTSVSFNPDLGYLGWSAFKDCESLLSADLPASLDSVFSETFAGCSSLASVSFGPRVEFIGQNAFAGCESLASAELPDTLTDIGSGAFSGCGSLKEIFIPKNVRSIGSGAFEAGILETLTVDAENSTFTSSGNCLINRSQRSVVLGVGEFEIPTDINLYRIEPRAFYGNTSVRTVVIPAGITSIGESAFEGCSNLENLTILSDYLHDIGQKAFRGCASLTSLDLSMVETIYQNAFEGCESLNRVQLSVYAWSLGRYEYDDYYFYLYEVLMDPEDWESVARLITGQYCGYIWTQDSGIFWNKPVVSG